MSRKQIDKVIDQLWTRYDADRSGYLERAEAHRMLADIFKVEGRNMSKAQMGTIIAIIDSDGDGRVDKSELKALLAG